MLRSDAIAGVWRERRQSQTLISGALDGRIHILSGLPANVNGGVRDVWTGGGTCRCRDV